MSIFFLLSLLLLPLFNAEQLQTKLENNDDLFMQRSGAVSYLYGLPLKQYQHPMMKPTIDRLPFLMMSNSDDQQKRGKRIYWENLAFQPADYHHKTKHPKRSN